MTTLSRREQTLMQIIDELDAAMRKQFAEQFLKIKEEFNTVFRQLFGGGKGTLELMEDEDILEAESVSLPSRQGKTSKYDAAFRRRKSVDGNFFIICDPEFKTVAVLSS